ncbi:MAG TPA: GlxA family transcriptional regulator [Steroidobacteraceae bacterium]|nr:GlxA family transcriptional regulator [Steroidobacteraceae bacterium]
MPTTRPPIRIGFLIFPGVTALDVVGPMDAFAAAINTTQSARSYYESIVIGTHRSSVRSESGLRLSPDCTLASAPDLDTVIVPGGAGLREAAVNSAVTAWLQTRARRIRRIASVCTGIYGLAPTGLIDGRRVTTHWAFADAVARQFPKLKMDSDAIYLRDGKFYTTAGMTAGIDMSLAMIQDDCGATVSLAVARELVVYLKRPGGQEQYSQPLRFQSANADRFGDLVAWIDANLHRQLSVDVLAKRIHVGSRHFSRQFKDATGLSPASFVESRRLDEARTRLEGSQARVHAIANSVGFRSSDAFRRAFERRFGVAPRLYRERFR